MRGCRLPERTHAFLSYFGRIRQYLVLERHLLPTSRYHKNLAARFDAGGLLPISA